MPVLSGNYSRKNSRASTFPLSSPWVDHRVTTSLCRGWYIGRVNFAAEHVMEELLVSVAAVRLTIRHQISLVSKNMVCAEIMSRTPTCSVSLLRSLIWAKSCFTPYHPLDGLLRISLIVPSCALRGSLCADIFISAARQKKIEKLK